MTATGWGLNPDNDAIYLNITPARNDGNTIYNLNVANVPVDGWSIGLYNAEGYFVFGSLRIGSNHCHPPQVPSRSESFLIRSQAS